MTCQFGEIVFPSSRAFWGDDDLEAIEEDSTKKFNIEWIEEAPVSIKKLIIIESELLIDFSEACLVKDLQKLCVIKNGKSKKEPSTVYKTDKDLCICVVGVDVDLPNSAHFVEKMQEILKLSKQIIAVTCDHVSHFKGNDKPDSPSFLRAICTKNARNLCENSVLFLSQPNIVSGVSSGVLSYAEIMDIPAIIYVLYTDTFALDSTSAVPLRNLFSSTVDFVLPEYITSTKGFFSKENLYM